MEERAGREGDPGRERQGFYQEFLRVHRSDGFVRFSEADIVSVSRERPWAVGGLQGYLARLRAEGDESLLHLCLTSRSHNRLVVLGMKTISSVTRALRDGTLMVGRGVGSKTYVEIVAETQKLQEERARRVELLD